MSQNTPFTETIGEVKYEIYMLPPLESHELLMDVAKMVGPALGPVLDKLFAGGSADLETIMDKELGSGFFSDALGGLFGGLEKSTLDRVIKAFRKVTMVDGVQLDKIFDRHFQGDLGSMYKWIGFGMKVQWGKSLSALVGDLGGLPALLAERSQSPTS